MCAVILAALLLPTAVAARQDFSVRVIDFDLAERPEGGAFEVPFPEGVMFQVRAVNLVPSYDYRFTTPTETIERPSRHRRPRGIGNAPPPVEPCKSILRALDVATSEAEVRGIGRAGGACDSWIEGTTLTFRVGVLGRGERFKYEARRPEASWTLAVFPESERVAEGELYDESFAVVVGIDEYPTPEWPRLNHAVKDAKSMARFLTQSGFEVIELYDQAATKQAIIAAMQNNVARKVGARDRVLVFFAGHGYTETLGGQEWGYVVPFDGGSSSAGFISMEELQAQSAKMGGATHQLFVMDSCYGGSLGTRGVSPLDPGLPGYLEEVTRRPARQIITAGGKDQQVADGGPRGHSVFTGFLLEALEDGLGDLNADGYITFSELNAYLVPRATSNLQTPAVGYLPAHGLGEFTFRSAREESPNEPRSGNALMIDDSYGGFTGRAAAEKIVSEYLAAEISLNISAIVDLADFPFYFDGEIILLKFDLVDHLGEIFAEKAALGPSDLHIESIRAKTIGELKAEGLDASRDRVLEKVLLRDADYAVIVFFDPVQAWKTTVFVRRTPSGLKIVGKWD